MAGQWRRSVFESRFSFPPSLVFSLPMVNSFFNLDLQYYGKLLSQSDLLRERAMKTLCDKYDAMIAEGK